MKFAQYLSEFLGSCGLAVVVVGSGIMGENLSNGNAALALLANSLATGAGLYALILCFAPISGAHFNPAVTLFAFLEKKISGSVAINYVLFQTTGALIGVFLTHALFQEDIFQLANRERSHWGLLLSEAVATFGLLLVIALAGKQSLGSKAAAVSLFIVSAYWCTSSTSFANPALTLARSLSDTFAGIFWRDAPAFIAAQVLGVLAATGAGRALKNHPNN